MRGMGRLRAWVLWVLEQIRAVFMKMQLVCMHTQNALCTCMYACKSMQTTDRCSALAAEDHSATQQKL